MPAKPRSVVTMIWPDVPPAIVSIDSDSRMPLHSYSPDLSAEASEHALSCSFKVNGIPFAVSHARSNWMLCSDISERFVYVDSDTFYAICVEFGVFGLFLDGHRLASMARAGEECAV